jgi:hypothetical protein
MNEQKVPNINIEKVVENKHKEYIDVALELAKNPEGFTFPGITEESYVIIKKNDEECAGFVTPIDDILEKMKTQGMKILFGKDQSNVFLLPKDSDNMDDSIMPKFLVVNDEMEDNLKKLILINRK